MISQGFFRHYTFMRGPQRLEMYGLDYFLIPKLSRSNSLATIVWTRNESYGDRPHKFLRMQQIAQSFRLPAQILNPSPSPPSQTQSVPAPSTPSVLKSSTEFSRRDVAIRTTSSFLLLGAHTVSPFPVPEARAEGESCTDRPVTKRAFIDVSIDGEPAGRIIIGLYGDDVPIGTTKFSNLLTGAAGISYRRKEFTKIMSNYVQHGGVRSYGADADLAKETGSKLAIDSLIGEWERSSEKCPGTKNVANSVSLVVRNPSKPPPKLKLVARQGKLEIDEEEVGTSPNGTEFVITMKDSPELDASALVVGRVLEGMDVAERIGKVKTVNDNTSSPYFRVAKLIGDKRAVVAERGFNRPYSKVLVTNCGLIN